MPLVQTQGLDPQRLSQHDRLQVYNGLDCGITLEIYQKLRQGHPLLLVYDFAKAMQAPALTMMLRGWKIDESARQAGAKRLQAQLDYLNRILQCQAIAWWDKPLNPRSPKQLQEFFYGAMKLPEQWISIKGQRKLSMGREVLEKLEAYFHAMPIIAAILAFRDCAKQLEVLQTAIDPDGRWRTSYNIVGTETGRWSSSKSSEGTGSNTQNLNPILRNMFVADPGYTLVGIDLEQTESRDVGWICGVLFDDWSYLDACEAGDLHTTVCKGVWPNLAWTGDKKQDRLVAEQPFYRHFSYRDMAKRGGHGSNYRGTPFTMARWLKVMVQVMETFQRGYFQTFPGIPKWHDWVAEQIQTQGRLVTPFGRERTFFGRPDDDATLREAIAYIPQSTTADRLNLGLYRIWRDLEPQGVQILGQVHDAVYFQVPQRLLLGEVIEQALALLKTPLEHKGRRFVVPGEAKWGWNWGQATPENPDGLAKWKGKVDRERTPLEHRVYA